MLGKRSEFNEDKLYDVIVIGGGINGCGSAFDAALRGCSVALIEKGDIASGTSSKSSKLFHGGLRYLKQLDFELIKESLTERDIAMNVIAPHLIKAQKFIYPLQHHLWERIYMGLGIFLYDHIGDTNLLPNQKHLSKQSIIANFPSIDTTKIIGGIEYYDSVMDDARYAINVALSAQYYNSDIFTYTSVELVDKILDNDENVYYTVTVKDLEQNKTYILKSKTIINALGPWSFKSNNIFKFYNEIIPLHPTKGVHIIVNKDKIDGVSGLTLQTKTSVLFVIPWLGKWLIGTTDTNWKSNIRHSTVTKSDIEYILKTVNGVLSVPLLPKDIIATYSGLRPLVSSEDSKDASPSSLSRSHRIIKMEEGCISIVGGKYTTYRLIAKDAVDAIIPHCKPSANNSITDIVPILGGENYKGALAMIPRLSNRYSIHATLIENLINRYGSMVNKVLELAEEREDLLKPLTHAEDYLRVEIIYAIRNEFAIHVQDILLRRTRISLLYSHRGLKVLDEVLNLMSDELGWNEEDREREKLIYTDIINFESMFLSSETDASIDDKLLEKYDSLLFTNVINK